MFGRSSRRIAPSTTAGLRCMYRRVVLRSAMGRELLDRPRRYHCVPTKSPNPTPVGRHLDVSTVKGTFYRLPVPKEIP